MFGSLPQKSLVTWMPGAGISSKISPCSTEKRASNPIRAAFFCAMRQAPASTSTPKATVSGLFFNAASATHPLPQHKSKKRSPGCKRSINACTRISVSLRGMSVQSLSTRTKKSSPKNGEMPNTYPNGSPHARNSAARSACAACWEETLLFGSKRRVWRDKPQHTRKISSASAAASISSPV